MSTYNPECATPPSNTLQASTTQLRIQELRNADIQAPTVPYMSSISLPPESTPPPGVSMEYSQGIKVDMYPLHITSHLTPGQQLRLHGIGMTTPIHVHSPVAHIGTITAVPPDQITTSLDVILFLQSIVTTPLDFHTTFAQLSSDVKEKIRREFFRRTGSTVLGVREGIWARFISGDLESDGPLGIDLLLGNNEIWGFEACSVGGYSIVHVASVGSV